MSTVYNLKSYLTQLIQMVVRFLSRNIRYNVVFLGEKYHQQHREADSEELEKSLSRM